VGRPDDRACTGLPEDHLVRAGRRAQAEYQRRVVSRGLSPDSPWESYYNLGLHKLAAADSTWTTAHFGEHLQTADARGVLDYYS
jgi:hypothetical protein